MRNRIQDIAAAFHPLQKDADIVRTAFATACAVSQHGDLT